MELLEDPSYVWVARLDGLPAGSARAVEIDGRDVALFNVDGALFAIEGSCPHQGGPLVDGWRAGFEIACPWHGWCFDLRTGAMALGAQFDSIETFDVQTDGADIFVARAPRSARG
ncbi:MAG: Rieske (2Fe-2S) protein [Vulcanimicrobiaceae bacterium]